MHNGLNRGLDVAVNFLGPYESITILLFRYLDPSQVVTGAARVFPHSPAIQALRKGRPIYDISVPQAAHKEQVLLLLLRLL